MERSRTWLTPFIILAALLLAVAIFIFLYQKTPFYFFIVFFTIYFSQVIITFIIFLSTRNMNAKLSWYIMIIVFPVFGTILYILFGRRYKNRLSFTNYLEHSAWWRNQNNEGSISKNIQTKSTTYKQFLKITKLSHKPHHAGKVNLIDSNQNIFKKLFDEIEKAEKFIHMEIYIIKPGEIFEKLKSVLLKKAKEGVEIKIIVDDFGRWALPWYAIREFSKKNINIKIFAKTYFPFIGSENGYRSHRKFTIIDGKIVITGGVNFSDEYAHFSKKYGYWTDLNFNLEGPIVKDYSLIFISDWKRITGDVLSIKKYAPLSQNQQFMENSNSTIITIESGPDNKYSVLHSVLINLIYSSKKRVWLATPYFAPTVELINALYSAIYRGVDVRLFIPGLPDKKSVYLTTKHFSSDLTKAGAKVYTMNHSFLHTKLGLCDDISFSGTMNLDLRSFYSQFEIQSFFIGDASVQTKKLFEDYLKFSKVILDNEWKKTSPIEKAKEVLIKFFLPLA